MEPSTKEFGPGWVTFAGVMFVIGGAADIIWGIAAIDGKEYLSESSLLFSTLDFWGAVSIIWGVVLLLGAYLLLSRSPIGVGTGIVLATISAIFSFFTLPALPEHALIAILIDALILYGLVHYGESQHI